VNFASDNTSGVHPQVLEAIERENAGFAHSYGADDASRRLDALYSELFETRVRVFPVLSGTAANAIALATLCPAYGAIVCHAHSHVLEDECGAVEHQCGGARLEPLPGARGRLWPDEVRAHFDRPNHGVHAMPARALSAAQVSEKGTVYRAGELAALGAVCRERELGFHLDGARFANALVATGRAPAELSWRAGVEVLSFGATKNGALAAEAVLLFDPDEARVRDVEYRRKRAGHLLSKQRFVACQLEAYVRDDLWLRNARVANARAARLAEGLRRHPAVELEYEVEANEIYLSLPAAWCRRLFEAGAQLLPEPRGGDRVGARLVTSFCTEEADVDRFLEVLRDCDEEAA